MEEHLQKHTTRSSIGFAGIFDKSRKNVISLLPGESNQTDGLRFQLYIERFKKLFRLSDDAALALLPQHRQPWKYYEAAGDDYSGFRGYFANEADVDRLLRGLAQKLRVSEPTVQK
jgi:hypothetical protein